VRVTCPPWQKVVGPPALIEGVEGRLFTATVIGAEEDVQPLAPAVVTVNTPGETTLIELEVKPLLHVFPFAFDEVNVTDPP
jgi:hypothetical protein